MYSKRLRCVLKRLFRIFLLLIKMCNCEKDKVRKKQYRFKPFKFEEIHPNGSIVPIPRSGHRLGADSSNFYSFGGYNPLYRHENSESDHIREESFPLFQELWKFNFATKLWKKYPNGQTLPLELASNALLLLGNVLMVYGGTGSPFGYRTSNQLHVCRVDNDNGLMVEISSTGQLPQPMYGQAIIYHNPYIYTIGGTSGFGYSCDIHRLNLRTLVWEAVYICKGIQDLEPEGRYRHEVGFDGKNIYILGGGTAMESFDLWEVPTFCIETRTWSKTHTIRDPKYGFPAARRCHGAVQISSPSGEQVFISGGMDGNTFFKDLWKLDLNTFKWTMFKFCELPIPTYFHATAATPEGRLYVFGGIHCVEENLKRNNVIYSTWLCIPRLSEICWEAILYYNPDLVNYDSDVLINVGLPRHFIQRLGNNKASQIT